MKGGPDFIGIGCQKAGTSWFMKNLREHPQVLVPIVKEFHLLPYSRHYYPKQGHFAFSETLNTNTRSLYRKWLKKRMRRQMFKLKLSLQDIKWFKHYWKAEQNANDYLKLFPKLQNKISGEFTPENGLVDENAIQALSHLQPDLKILLFCRNPIDRAWSRLKDRSHQLQAKERGEEQLLEELKSRDVVAKGDAAFIYQRWRKYFPASNFQLVFFDEIKKEPKKVMEAICTFLKIKSIPFSQLEQKVLSTHQLEMPNSFLQEAQKLLAYQICAMEKLPLNAGQMEIVKSWKRNLSS